MKLIKLNDIVVGTIYINTDRIISVGRWVENDGCQFCEGSTVEYWDGKGIVELEVNELPEKIMEMVNK